MTDPNVDSRPGGPAPEGPAWLDREAYPFESHRLKLPGGAHMHFVDEGRGGEESLLFVHGTPTWSFEWRNIIRGLAPRFRCVAPDHLGFGLSDRPRDAPYTPEWHAANLQAFVDRLGLDSFTLVVHDFGGPIGLPLALNGSGRTRRLVVMNTFMWSLRGDRSVERAAKLLGGGAGRFLYRHINLSLRVIAPSAFADRKKLTRKIHGQYLAPFTDPWSREAVLWPLARALTASEAHYEALWQARSELRKIPSLLVWGMKDPAFGPAHLQRWKETLPAAEVVELPVGHWPHEEAPEDVLTALQRFVMASAG